MSLPTSLQEAVERQSKNPQRRAHIEHALQILGDAQPVESAYRRALLDNDAKTVEKILISKRIFRLREKAKHSPIFADLMQHQVNKLKELEASC